MKTLLTLVPLALAPLATAAVISSSYTGGFENSGTLTDGSLVPWSDTRSVGGTGQTVTSVTVRLTVAGGYNGDLYGYLSHGGVQVVLLNRPGVGTGNAFGYADAGLDVSFSDAAAHNIHTYQTVVGYSLSGGTAWQPDGRSLSPVGSAPSAFDAAGTGALANFAGLDPAGSWTLVLADVSGGGGQATVLSWGLSLTVVPVPEPAATAAGTAAALLALAACRRATRRQ